MSISDECPLTAEAFFRLDHPLSAIHGQKLHPPHRPARTLPKCHPNPTPQTKNPNAKLTHSELNTGVTADNKTSRGKIANPANKFTHPHTTFTTGDESPRPGGLANGVGNASPRTPAARCGNALQINTPARKLKTINKTGIAKIPHMKQAAKSAARPSSKVRRLPIHRPHPPKHLRSLEATAAHRPGSPEISPAPIRAMPARCPPHSNNAPSPPRHDAAKNIPQ